MASLKFGNLKLADIVRRVERGSHELNAEIFQIFGSDGDVIVHGGLGGAILTIIATAKGKGRDDVESTLAEVNGLPGQVATVTLEFPEAHNKHRETYRNCYCISATQLTTTTRNLPTSNGMEWTADFAVSFRIFRVPEATKVTA